MLLPLVSVWRRLTARCVVSHFPMLHFANDLMQTLVEGTMFFISPACSFVRFPHRGWRLQVDEHMTTWRFKHVSCPPLACLLCSLANLCVCVSQVTMVHRMLGTKIGTGGSSGYGILHSSRKPTPTPTPTYIYTHTHERVKRICGRRWVIRTRCFWTCSICRRT